METMASKILGLKYRSTAVDHTNDDLIFDQYAGAKPKTNLQNVSRAHGTQTLWR
jgi:hypothetical protein